MISRRKFLLTGLGVIAVVSVGGILLGPRAAEREIADYIRKRLGFLKLDEAGLQRFAADQVSFLMAKRPTWARMKYHFTALFTKTYTKYGMSTDTRTRLQRLNDSFTSVYLLSSTYFTSGSDPGAVVEYISFFDPMRACGNPFARPAVAAASTSS